MLPTKRSLYWLLLVGNTLPPGANNRYLQMKFVRPGTSLKKFALYSGLASPTGFSLPTDTQVLYAVALARRNGVGLSHEALSDRAALSASIEELQKGVRPAGSPAAADPPPAAAEPTQVLRSSERNY